jgi:chromosome segregation ATPase
MSASEERLTTLEKTVASLRNDFLQAIIENTRSMTTLNKVVLQQEQNARDANHEITILTGAISSQERDIKDIKNRMDSFDLHFASLEDKFASLDGKITSLDGRFASLDGKLVALDGRFTSLEDKFASLDGKLEQVLQVLTTPLKTD